jgi:hypothetical protein
MDWKKFLKPNWRKIGLFVVLFLLLTPLFIFNMNLSEKGFPFPYLYYLAPEDCREINGNVRCIYTPMQIFNVGYFILDVFICGIISYILSCFIIWSKINKKSSLISLISFIILILELFVWLLFPNLTALHVNITFTFIILILFLGCGLLWIYDRFRGRKK